VPEAGSFDAFYYRHCCGQPYERNDAWLSFFGSIADRIVADINPRTVLDAGCAIGLLVECLRARGVEAEGVDLSTWAIAHATDAARPYVREGSIATPFEKRYDLIVCIEVLEHMPAAEAETAIANFAAHTGDVLFSSTPFDYKEPTHVNVRMPEDWAESFARHGFFRDVDFDGGFVTKWAARFTRREVPASRLARDYERRFWQLRAAEQDARAFSVETQSRLAAAEAERDRQREALEDAGRRLSDADQALAAANTRIGALTEERDDAVADANETALKLGAALDTIRHMESSAFWRARRLINRILHR
jgi:hypothetical protein